jgi:hypothetical protein
MRAFTTLAGHILGSHPQINGYYEMHVSYDSAPALRRQLDLFLKDDDLKAGSRYLFDKLLHNDYLLQPERLGIDDVKILVALRDPEQSIRSIVNLFAKKATDELYASPIEATEYYCERIKTLAGFCRTPGQAYYYFDAEMLQLAPEILLPRLSHWLDLDSPLTDSYTIFSQTGESRKGDSSSNIQSGSIVREKSDYSAITIPGQQLEMARQVYRDCRRQIIDGALDSITDSE